MATGLLESKTILTDEVPRRDDDNDEDETNLQPTAPKVPKTEAFESLESKNSEDDYFESRLMRLDVNAVSLEDDIKRLVDYIESKWETKQQIILKRMLKVIFMKPIDLFLYGTVIGALNKQSCAIGLEFLSRLFETHSYIMGHKCNLDYVHYIFILLASLVHVRCLDAESYLQYLAQILQFLSTDDNRENSRDVSSIVRLNYIYMIATSLIYIHKTLIKSLSEKYDEFLTGFWSLIRQKPIVHCLKSLSPYSSAHTGAQYSILDMIVETLDIKNEYEPIRFIMSDCRDIFDFSDASPQLITSERTLDCLSNLHLSASDLMMPLYYLDIYPLINTHGSASNLEKFQIFSQLQLYIRSSKMSGKLTTQTLVKLTKQLEQKVPEIEKLVLYYIFCSGLSLTRLHNPSSVPVSLLLQFCRQDSDKSPQIVYCYFKTLWNQVTHYSVPFLSNIAKIFAHFLINNNLYWPWDHFNHLALMPEQSSSWFFIRQICTEVLHLSFFDRVAHELPEEAFVKTGILPAEPAVDLSATIIQISEWTQESDFYHNKIRRSLISDSSKESKPKPVSTNEILRILEMVSLAPDQKLSVLMTLLFDFGHKSLTHFSASFKKFGDAISSLIGADGNAEESSKLASIALQLIHKICYKHPILHRFCVQQFFMKKILDLPHLVDFVCQFANISNKFALDYWPMIHDAFFDLQHRISSDANESNSEYNIEQVHMIYSTAIRTLLNAKFLLDDNSEALEVFRTYFLPSFRLLIASWSRLGAVFVQESSNSKHSASSDNSLFLINLLVEECSGSFV